MQVQEAVTLAKQHMAKLMSEENIENLGLEAVEREGVNWRVTLGFSRPWDYPHNRLAQLAPREALPKRSYKTVLIDDKKEEIVAVKNYEGRSE